MIDDVLVRHSRFSRKAFKQMKYFFLNILYSLMNNNVLLGKWNEILAFNFFDHFRVSVSSLITTKNFSTRSQNWQKFKQSNFEKRQKNNSWKFFIYNIIYSFSFYKRNAFFFPDYYMRNGRPFCCYSSKILVLSFI